MQTNSQCEAVLEDRAFGSLHVIQEGWTKSDCRNGDTSDGPGPGGGGNPGGGRPGKGRFLRDAHDNNENIIQQRHIHWWWHHWLRFIVSWGHDLLCFLLLEKPLAPGEERYCWLVQYQAGHCDC